MEMTVQRLSAVRQSDGITVPAAFPATPATLTIPAHTTATLLLDQGYNTNAYPTLLFSKGKDAGISLGYAEALYIRKTENIDGYWIPTLPKGNRNEVAGKIFIGKKDSIISDGSTAQNFTPLWWRTYRYLQLTVTTQDEALLIDDLYGTFTGYPISQQRQAFSARSRNANDAGHWLAYRAAVRF